jgi:hypothetical protein
MIEGHKVNDGVPAISRENVESIVSFEGSSWLEMYTSSVGSNDYVRTAALQIGLQFATRSIGIERNTRGPVGDCEDCECEFWAVG